MFKEVAVHGPGIKAKVFLKLLKVKMKRLFNTVISAGPCLREHGPSIDVKILERLLNIKTKILFNTVK